MNSGTESWEKRNQWVSELNLLNQSISVVPLFLNLVLNLSLCGQESWTLASSQNIDSWTPTPTITTTAGH